MAMGVEDQQVGRSKLCELSASMHSPKIAEIARRRAAAGRPRRTSAASALARQAPIQRGPVHAELRGDLPCRQLRIRQQRARHLELLGVE